MVCGLWLKILTSRELPLVDVFSCRTLQGHTVHDFCCIAPCLFFIPFTLYPLPFINYSSVLSVLCKKMPTPL